MFRYDIIDLQAVEALVWNTRNTIKIIKHKHNDKHPLVHKDSQSILNHHHVTFLSEHCNPRRENKSITIRTISHKRSFNMINVPSYMAIITAHQNVIASSSSLLHSTEAVKFFLSPSSPLSSLLCSLVSY